MKQQKILFVFIILFIINSCEPPATFNEPQPPNKASLLKFPKGLMGEYLASDDNTILKITDKMILSIYDYDKKMHRNKLDSNYKIAGDTLINISSKEKSVIRIEGDSIVQHIHSVDTSFAISEKNVLKKFKGYYFLNINRDKSGWEVRKLELSKGKLLISSVSKKEDIDKLKEISESAIDTVPYKFKPTKKQFRKFIREKGFRDTETYIKVK